MPVSSSPDEAERERPAEGPAWTPDAGVDGPQRTRPENELSPAQGGAQCEKSGGVLLSQGHSAQVPSALEGLTSVFGMGTGVTLPLSPPKLVVADQRSARSVLLENSIASTNTRTKFQSETKPSAD